MRIRLAIPDRIINPEILNSVLEATTRANQALLANGEAPSVEEAIRAGARWKPENFSDGEHFDLAPTVATRRWGDCDDWAPYLAAQLRNAGDTKARAFAKKSGPKRYHASVLTGSGQEVDPSKWAGMKSRRPNGIPPAICGAIACAGEGALAVVPYGNAWAGRMDIPFGARHLSGHALAISPELAAIHAANGAMMVGGAMDQLSEEQIEALCHLVNGLTGDPDDAEVGSFLDSILDTASSLAPVASLIPGVGPIAAAAIPMAGSLLKGLTGSKAPAAPPPPPGAAPPGYAPPAASQASRGVFEAPAMPMPGGMQSLPIPGGGHVAYNPHNPGPIIVRF